MSLLMLVALPANAQVESMVDFYGKYKFTADMTVTEAGKGMEANFSDNCDVTIAKDNSVVGWDAAISGIAGAVNGTHNVNGIDTDSQKFKVQNWNGSNQSLWNGGIWMSNAEGIYPFGWGDMPQLENLYFSYDPATLTISIPDFTLVTVDHGAGTATIVASFKNAKLTLVEVEKIEIVDISGEWHATPAGAYGTKEGSALPTEYDFTLTKTKEESKKHIYTVDFKVGEYPTVQSTATFDGNSLIIAMDSLVFDAENNVYACSQWGNANTEVSYTYSSETTLTMDSPLCLGTPAVGKDAAGNDSAYVEMLQWYMNGVAKKDAPEVETFDWTGTYIVKPGTVIPGEMGDIYPTEFEMEISTNESNGKYYITKFYGHDTSYGGGIPFTPSEDNANEATFNTASTYITITAGELYYRIFDGNGGSTPISVKLNEDGTLSIGDIFIMQENFNTGEKKAVVFYQGVTATKEVVGPYDFAGVYDVTATVVSEDGRTYPEAFEMAIEYKADYDNYYITYFLNSNTYQLSQGGFCFESRTDNSAAIKTNKSVIMIEAGKDYQRIFDINGGSESLAVTVNADQSLSIADFTLYNASYDDNWTLNITTKAATYTNVKAVKNGKDPVSIQTIEKAPAKVTVNDGVINIEGGAQTVVVYDIAGRVEFSGVASSVANLAKGIHIVKVGNNVVKVNVK